jgi:hypothetical protein
MGLYTVYICVLCIAYMSIAVLAYGIAMKE